MKKTRQSILLCYILISVLQWGISQDVAHAQPTHYPKSSTSANAYKSLKDVLTQMKEHYQVDILYFDRVISGYTISDNVVKLNVSIEQNLKAVLKPIGLDYKKTKNGGYIILAKEK